MNQFFVNNQEEQQQPSSKITNIMKRIEEKNNTIQSLRAALDSSNNERTELFNELVDEMKKNIPMAEPVLEGLQELQQPQPTTGGKRKSSKRSNKK